MKVRLARKMGRAVSGTIIDITQQEFNTTYKNKCVALDTPQGYQKKDKKEEA